MSHLPILTVVFHTNNDKTWSLKHQSAIRQAHRWQNAATSKFGSNPQILPAQHTRNAKMVFWYKKPAPERMQKPLPYAPMENYEQNATVHRKPDAIAQLENAF